MYVQNTVDTKTRTPQTPKTTANYYMIYTQTAVQSPKTVAIYKLNQINKQRTKEINKEPKNPLTQPVRGRSPTLATHLVGHQSSWNTKGWNIDFKQLHTASISLLPPDINRTLVDLSYKSTE